MSKEPICQWPAEDRPREKLFREGEQALTDSELLAILIRTGCRGQSALDLARNVVKEFKSFREMSCAETSQWKSLKGLGSSKIAQIKAAIEIGRRLQEEQIKKEGVRIESSKDIVEILMPRMRDLKKEQVRTIFLNAKNYIIHIDTSEEGTVNYAHPIIREIFQKALQLYAASLICIHNHPSGDSLPSVEDKDFTQKLCVSGEVLGVSVLDHIIIGNDEYYSFLDAGELNAVG